MYKKLAYVGFTSYSLGCIGVDCGGTSECYDINGRTISPGFHFVPGPDTCTLCVCDNGNPKWCKAVLCSPPQDCKSFRVGNSCCEFICLDDTFGGKGGVEGGPHDLASEFGLRLIAGAITAILCLSIIFFSIHRLRQRKIRGRQPPLHHLGHQPGHHSGDSHHDASSIGYIAGSLRYLPDCDEYGDVVHHHELQLPHYSLWKPSSYTSATSAFPRGQEAPPPYEEAVAAAQVEAALAAAVAAATAANSATGPSLLLHHQHHHHSSSSHRTIPMTLATTAFPPPPQQSPSGGANTEPSHQPPPTHRTVATVATMATTDLLPLVLPPPNRGRSHQTTTTTQSPPLRVTNSEVSVTPPHTSNSGATTVVVLPPPPPPHSRGVAFSDATAKPPVLPPPSNNISNRVVADSSSQVSNTVSSRLANVNSRLPAVGSNSGTAHAQNSLAVRLPSLSAAQHHTMAMTSIAEEEQDVESAPPPTIGEEEDDEEDEEEEDYRSECENCNLSAGGTLNDADCFVDDLETMTLHRRPQPPPPLDSSHSSGHSSHLGSHLSGHHHHHLLGHHLATGGLEWTSLTLPTNCRTSQPRPTSVLCNSAQTSARENWFSSMPQTSSESSEEEE